MDSYLCSIDLTRLTDLPNFRLQTVQYKARNLAEISFSFTNDEKSGRKRSGKCEVTLIADLSMQYLPTQWTEVNTMPNMTVSVKGTRKIIMDNKSLHIRTSLDEDYTPQQGQKLNVGRKLDLLMKQESLTEADFRLPTFGLPEPLGVTPVTVHTPVASSDGAGCFAK